MGRLTVQCSQPFGRLPCPSFPFFRQRTILFCPSPLMGFDRDPMANQNTLHAHSLRAVGRAYHRGALQLTHYLPDRDGCGTLARYDSFETERITPPDVSTRIATAT